VILLGNCGANSPRLCGCLRKRFSLHKGNIDPCCGESRKRIGHVLYQTILNRNKQVLWKEIRFSKIDRVGYRCEGGISSQFLHLHSWLLRRRLRLQDARNLCCYIISSSIIEIDLHGCVWRQELALKVQRNAAALLRLCLLVLQNAAPCQHILYTE
jgi:hypothetical protein